ncbi:hypothetical protein GF325_00465, partial [Candidatus Bathyarchaeota archaeon]|nr:hypothetical protein [Candidatus Bathyarchaeota archaeon]
RTPIKNDESLEIKLDDLCSDPARLVAILACKLEDGTHFTGDVVDLTPSSQVDHGAHTPHENATSGALVVNWNVPTEGEWWLLWYFHEPTGQRVKRATTGAEGLVLNHLDGEALRIHSNAITSAMHDRFGESLGDAFNAFFCDSWEVSDSTWTWNFLELFQKHAGYDLKEYLPLLNLPRLDPCKFGEIGSRINHDYNEFRSNLILKEFFQQFVNACHEAGVSCRVQPYSAPVDLLRAYAMLDILEIEGFGRKGISSKYYRSVDPRLPSSAARFHGKDLVSCESFTWLGEHFTVSLAMIKREVDQIILHGVNRIIYHGYPMSPPEAGVPGWVFYASIMANHNNPWWKYTNQLNLYIARNCFLSKFGNRVADIAVYIPYHDTWSGNGEILKNLQAELRVLGHLSDFDYLNDDILLEASPGMNGRIRINGYSQECLVMYHVNWLPLPVAKKLHELTSAGCRVYFIGNLPVGAPGFSALQSGDDIQVKEMLRNGSNPTNDGENNKFLKFVLEDLHEVDLMLDREGITRDFTERPLDGGSTNLKYLHVKNENINAYFVVNCNDIIARSEICLRSKGLVESWNPLDGSTYRLDPISDEGDLTRLLIHLEPFGSRWLIFHEDDPVATSIQDQSPPMPELVLEIKGQWRIHFIFTKNSFPPENEKIVKMEVSSLFDWKDHPEVCYFSGTAIYHIVVDLDMDQNEENHFLLDLGEVHEIATVTINGIEVGTTWHGNHVLDVTDCLKDGSNSLEIQVTNLLLNRVIGFARNGKQWRPDYYFVDITYNTFNPELMDLLPSGLLGPVKLKKLRI